MEVACPHCGTRVQCAPSPVGSIVACPRCGQRFQTPPSVAAVRPVQPEPEPDWVEEVNTPASRRTTKRLATVDKFSIWYLLDWKFEHYLTPWIVRAYWVLAIVCGGLLIILLAVKTISDVFPEKQAAVRGMHPLPPIGRPRIQEGWDEQPEQPSAAELEWRRYVSQTAEKMEVDIGAFALVLALLLSVRIGCESIIVLFNIAASASAIERSLKARPLAD